MRKILFFMILFIQSSVFAMNLHDLDLNETAIPYYLLATDLVQKPSPLIIDHQAYLTYEIYLSNLGKYSFKLDKVEVMDAEHQHKVLYTYDAAQLSKMIKSFANPNDSTSLIIHPGMRDALFFMEEFNKKNIPGKLLHRFYLSIVDPDVNEKQQIPESTMIVAAPVKVDTQEPVIVGAPLHGSHWVAFNGPSNTSIHRRAQIVGDGNIYFPERFAIDFIQFDANGNMYRNNDPSKNENWISYGANIYSVADGKVIAVKDGLADNKPPGRDYPITFNTIAGNYVIIDIGHHQYAFYAHFIPQSITVRVGDHVNKGEVIGRLGNSGNSDAPHLHFHIIDQANPLLGQGIPYGFAEFETEQYSFPNSGDQPVSYAGHIANHKKELVHENAMMNFEGK